MKYIEDEAIEFLSESEEDVECDNTDESESVSSCEDSEGSLKDFIVSDSESESDSKPVKRRRVVLSDGEEVCEKRRCVVTDSD